MSELRTAALIFDAEISSGAIGLDALGSPAVRRAVRVRGVPSRPGRLAQQALAKLGVLGYERNVVRPLLAARERLLGDAAAAPPRFLIRVDEFPHYRAWDEAGPFGTDAFLRFHEVMRGVEAPYLLAVLPRVSREPLDPNGNESRPLRPVEVATLRRLRADGVCVALHGRDHRTRFASPHRHSELCGLDTHSTSALLDAGIAELTAQDAAPEVFVAPYNRFDASQMPPLASRFAVVCGGPESVGTLGFQTTPQWRGETVYMPSYPPFYGTAAQMLHAVEDAIERRTGLWTPIVLHWEWEARDGWRGLARLAEVASSYVSSWQDFLDATRRSRNRPAA
jgi:Uncharacterized protein conserved in bacteria (DUF2334)